MESMQMMMTHNRSNRYFIKSWCTYWKMYWPCSTVTTFTAYIKHTTEITNKQMRQDTPTLGLSQSN